MANLDDLLKKKAPADGQAGTTHAPAGNTAESKGSDASTASIEPVSSESKDSQSILPKPRNPFADDADSGTGNDGGRNESSGGSPSDGEQPRPKLASLNLGSTPSAGTDSAGSVAVNTGVSLDSLDSSTDEGIAPRAGMSSFADETPAQRPTRELPEGLDRDSLSFIDMIDGVYEVLHEPDMLGGVIRNIIMELDKNPEYIKLVAPSDIRTWVRGMRDSMGLARIKKTEAKAKRAGGSGSKSKLVDADMLKDLEELGIGGLD